MQKAASLDEVLDLAKRLSLTDKVRLIERIAPEIEHELQDTDLKPKPRVSLRGLWQGVNISEEDIAEARREMWGNFPHEDI